VGGAPAALNTLTGNILYSLNSDAWTLALANPSNLGTSNNNYFFSPYKANHISASGAKSLAAWQTYSGKDGASKEHWFTLTPGDPPNSQIFYNETDQIKIINLGGTVYKDLNQNHVQGSLTLQPYQSKVLVVSDGPDVIAPAILSSLRATPYPISAASVDFRVTFSEAVTGVNPIDFTATTTGITGASVTDVSGSGTIYTVTVSSGTGKGTLRLDVLVGATITDLAGNPLAGLPFTGGESYIIGDNLFLPLILR
jgi:hypothetical protein